MLWAIVLALTLPPDARGAAPTGDAARGNSVRTLNVRGFFRRCIVHLPPAYTPTHPLPLVLLFHGAGGCGAEALRMTGWAQKADAAGFVVAAPDALPLDPEAPPSDANLTFWADSDDPSEFRKAVIDDDAALVPALLKDLESRYAIDTRRIYAVGFSSGARFVFRLGTLMPERFAALAPVCGVFNAHNPTPSRPVPVLLILGLEDPVFPYHGGISVMDDTPISRPPVLNSVAYWAKREGFSTQPEVRQANAEPLKGDGLTILAFGPPAGPQTLVYVVAGMGHTWPGSPVAFPAAAGPMPHALNGVDVIWDFFSRHTLP